MDNTTQVLKRCQAGTRNYEEANNLHAACYGMIGKLLAQQEQESVAFASIKIRVGNMHTQQFITQEMLHNVDDPWRLITIYAEQCIEELKEKNT